MNFLKLSLCSFIIITLVLGCSSGDKEVVVKPLNLVIKGDLGNYLEIVDDSYKIIKSSKTGNNWEITFKLKKNESSNLSIPLVQSIENKSIELDFKLTLTDDAGKPINGLNDFWMADGLINNSEELDKLKALLKEKNGTEEWFTLATNVDYESDYKDKLPEGISKFTIRTAEKIIESQTQTNFTSFTDSPSGINEFNQQSEDIEENNNCDVALTEYEQFVDEYIQFVEKASEGDYSVMAEAPSLMKKAEKAGRKVQNIGQANLGSTCWEKYLLIQQKLAEAALHLSKNLPKNMNNLQKQFDDIKNLIPD